MKIDWKRVAKTYRARARFYKFGNDSRGASLERLQLQVRETQDDAVDMAEMLKDCAKELYYYASHCETTVKHCEDYGIEADAIMDKYKEEK